MRHVDANVLKNELPICSKEFWFAGRALEEFA